MVSNLNTPPAASEPNEECDRFVFQELPRAEPSAAPEERNEDPELLRLLDLLGAANALWNDPLHGPRGSALAALQAVTEFLHRKGHGQSEVTRAFDALCLELHNARASQWGAFSPSPDDGNQGGRKPRWAIAYMKAAAAYAAESLQSETIDVAVVCSEVESILRVHGFTAGKEPVNAIGAWLSSCASGNGKMGSYFRRFRAASPFRTSAPERKREAILDWLANEVGRTALTIRPAMQAQSESEISG